MTATGYIQIIVIPVTATRDIRRPHCPSLLMLQDVAMRSHCPSKSIRFEGDVSRTPDGVHPIPFLLISIGDIHPIGQLRAVQRAQSGIDHLEVLHVNMKRVHFGRGRLNTLKFSLTVQATL